MAQYSFLSSGESRDLAHDIRALFDDLAISLKHEQRAYSGECHPAIDVVETDTAMEVVVDACGIAPEAIRILFRDNALIIAGEKAPTQAAADQTYHLVEREFGRFARAVRVVGAYDVAQARALLRNGELRIRLPKLKERRGQRHAIAVVSEPA